MLKNDYLKWSSPRCARRIFAIHRSVIAQTAASSSSLRASAEGRCSAATGWKYRPVTPPPAPPPAVAPAPRIQSSKARKS